MLAREWGGKRKQDRSEEIEMCWCRRGTFAAVEGFRDDTIPEPGLPPKMALVNSNLIRK